VISPFIKPDTVSTQPYDHDSLLRRLEDFFGLPHLGYVGAKDLSGFDIDVFTDMHAKHH
jgi:phosphatidylinositol-3-phosphatase